MSTSARADIAYLNNTHRLPIKWKLFLLESLNSWPGHPELSIYFFLCIYVFFLQRHWRPRKAIISHGITRFLLLLPYIYLVIYLFFGSCFHEDR